MEFKYNYLKGETPEERLRNKLQPLFSLVDILLNDDRPTVSHILMAKESKEDIRDLLDDINPFYSTMKAPSYKTDSTFPKIPED